MFRFFENLVDPYGPYPERDQPPQTLWRFMLDYAQPFKKVFWITGITSVLVAEVEIALIWVMGWIVDLLQGDPALVWETHGVTLIALVVFILILRPAIQAANVLLLNNTILPNFGTVIRWRAHAHVLRQSVGWF